MSGAAQPGPVVRSVFRLYKAILSPVLRAISPTQCKFLPTCSEYAYVAVSRHGLWRGAGLAVCRLARCHPFTEGGFDPVPTRTSGVKERTAERRASKPLRLS